MLECDFRDRTSALYEYLCDGFDWFFQLAVIRAELELLERLRNFESLRALWERGAATFLQEFEPFLCFDELHAMVRYRVRGELICDPAFCKSIAICQTAAPSQKCNLYFEGSGCKPYSIHIASLCAQICELMDLPDRDIYALNKARLGSSIAKHCPPPPFVKEEWPNLSKGRSSYCNLEVIKKNKKTAKYRFDLPDKIPDWYENNGSRRMKSRVMDSEHFYRVFKAVKLFHSTDRDVDSWASQVEPDSVYRVINGLEKFLQKLRKDNSNILEKDIPF